MKLIKQNDYQNQDNDNPVNCNWNQGYQFKKMKTWVIIWKINTNYYEIIDDYSKDREVVLDLFNETHKHVLSLFIEYE